MALLPPVPGGTLTQRFGNQTLSVEPAAWHVGLETAMYGRYSGAVYAAHFHLGTDFAQAGGANIVASETGRVLYAANAANPGPFGGGGLTVEVAIAGGLHYVSCHCSSISVRVGQSVARGQIIAHVGRSGLATGNHDHFAVFTKSSYGSMTFRNPEHFLPGGKYAGSSLIRPAGLPDTSSSVLIAVNGVGVNIRKGAGLSHPIYATSKADGIYRVSDNKRLWSLGTGFAFTRWVVASGVPWAEVKTAFGLLYIVHYLCHAIRGTLPPKP